MSSIVELLRVLPKPARPHCAVTEVSEWLRVEEELKTPLPSDYKDFIGTYGTGTVGDFVLIFNPFSTHRPMNFFYYMDFVLSMERKRHKVILPLFPDPDGLLPFAKTYDGDNLFWQTSGEPDEWPVVVKEVRSRHYEVYPMTMTDFLLKLIVPNPDRKMDILRNSRILKTSFERKAPFESLWVLLEKKLQNFKRRLIREVPQERREVSRSKLEELLNFHGLELETELIQQQLETWRHEGFIELLKGESVYLRVLRDKT